MDVGRPCRLHWDLTFCCLLFREKNEVIVYDFSQDSCFNAFLSRSAVVQRQAYPEDGRQSSPIILNLLAAIQNYGSLQEGDQQRDEPDGGEQGDQGAQPEDPEFDPLALNDDEDDESIQEGEDAGLMA